MKEKVYEWCPFCEFENEFEVGENTWIEKCECCGRPVLLCDRCYPHDKCGCCPHERKLHKEMKKWENEQIGKIVYWRNEDGDCIKDYCKVIGFEDDVYILKPLFHNKNNETIRVFDGDMDFLNESDMVEVYIKFFKSQKFFNNSVKI